MPQIIGPAPVFACQIVQPLILPDGRHVCMLGLQLPDGEHGLYFSDAPPRLRDASNRPIALTEDLGAGSMVRVACQGAYMQAVQVVEQAWTDPFALEALDAA